MHVEPVSHFPPASSRTLDEWLSADLSQRTPPEFRTRLRVIAAQQAARVAACSAFISLGVLASFAAIVLLAYGAPVAGPLAMVIVGVALASGCLLLARRAMHRIPPANATPTSRGPSSARGGLFAASGILLLFTALSSPMWLRDPTLLWVNAGMAALLFSTMVFPAAIVSRGAESLRRRASRDGALRAALERERQAFVPSPGVPAFGPL